MEDPVVILSAVAILACFMLLFRFISRLGIIEAQGMLGPTNLGQRAVPSRPVVGVQNPFSLNLTDNHIRYTSPEKGLVRLTLSSTVACYVTVYWGVKKETLQSALHEQDEVDDGSEDGSESESEEDNRTVPMEHVLAGSYVDRGPSEFYESSSHILLEAEVPTDFLPIVQQSHSAVYPMVVAMEASVNANSQHYQQVDIVAALGVFLVPSPGNNQFVKESECVQTADGKMFTVKKLYVTQGEAGNDRFPDEGTQNHQLDSLDLNNPNSSDFSNTMCVICHSLPVTHALLPCRHTCVCGICFKKIVSCPMCRAPISSFFKVQDEAFLQDTEPNASSELNRMSVWEIISGISSAD